MKNTLNKKKITIRCPYCGAEAKLRPATAVYGDRTIDPRAYVYLCDRYPKCDAYVYAHPQTKRPMGTPANGDLRNRRIRAHHAFDRLWKSGYMTKDDAYCWLQSLFGLPPDQAHIAMFGEYRCDRVVEAVEQVAKRAAI